MAERCPECHNEYPSWSRGVCPTCARRERDNRRYGRKDKSARKKYGRMILEPEKHREPTSERKTTTSSKSIPKPKPKHKSSEVDYTSKFQESIIMSYDKELIKTINDLLKGIQIRRRRVKHKERGWYYILDDNDTVVQSSVDIEAIANAFGDVLERPPMEFEQALEVIEALAEGVNPESGELFADESYLRNPRVMRALEAAKESLTQSLKPTHRK